MAKILTHFIHRNCRKEKECEKCDAIDFVRRPELSVADNIKAAVITHVRKAHRGARVVRDVCAYFEWKDQDATGAT